MSNYYQTMNQRILSRIGGQFHHCLRQWPFQFPTPTFRCFAIGVLCLGSANRLLLAYHGRRPEFLQAFLVSIEHSECATKSEKQSFPRYRIWTYLGEQKQESISAGPLCNASPGGFHHQVQRVPRVPDQGFELGCRGCKQVPVAGVYFVQVEHQNRPVRH